MTNNERTGLTCQLSFTCLKDFLVLNCIYNRQKLGNQAVKITAVCLLLKKMTEKTIPNPNPAPVRRNAVSED